MGSLTDILSGNAAKAAEKQINGLVRGSKGASEQLGLGFDTYKDYAGRALGEYDAYEPQAQKAYGLYGDALGINGAQGNSNATAAFQAGPGYQWSVDQATQAALRAGSAQGMLGSGNTTAAITDRASGLAGQEYGGWLDRLGGLGAQGIGMAGQQAGIQTGVGQAGQNYRGQLGQIAWNTETGIGNAQAQKEQAEGAGLLGGISLGTSLLGNLGGIGGIAKGIGGLFGGGGGGMAYNGNQIGGLY